MKTKPKNSSDKTSEKRNYTITILILLNIFTIIACILGGLYFLNRPIDPPLDIIRSTPTQTIVAAIAPKDSSSFCSETGSMLILVIGADVPETDFPKGADAIRFVEVDFTNQEVTILAIPRDLWVSTPSLAGEGYSSERLGQTYFIGKNLATSNEDEVKLGSSVLAQTFYDNFGLIPDYYVTLNMEAFAKMVDSIGGISINIPEDFTGGIYMFSAGEQQIGGDMLVDYSRTFLVGTEWNRLYRQDIVLQALKGKFLSTKIIPRIPVLFSQFTDVISTDLSSLQIINLGCMIKNVSDENTQFVEISPDMVSIDLNNLMLPSTDKIIELINNLFGD